MEVRTVAVDDPGLDWVEVPIPGSTPAVRLARLHVDPGTRASVSFVRFPAGWTRPGTGHYTCAEEFVVLDGRISVSGREHPVGTHVFLPPGTARTDSTVAPGGCLVVAWFSAAPDWRPGLPASPPEHAARHRPLHGRRRAGPPLAPGTSAADATAPGGSPDGPGGTEAFSLSARLWAFAPPGHSLPELPEPLLMRPWPRPPHPRKDI